MAPYLSGNGRWGLLRALLATRRGVRVHALRHHHADVGGQVQADALALPSHPLDPFGIGLELDSPTLEVLFFASGHFSLSRKGCGHRSSPVWIVYSITPDGCYPFIVRKSSGKKLDCGRIFPGIPLDIFGRGTYIERISSLTTRAGLQALLRQSKPSEGG